MIKKINFSFVIFLFSIIILNTILCINIVKKEKAKENIVRLHVVANSNSLNDQITKLRVYEKVNKYINEISKNASTSKEILNVILANKDKIIEISNNELIKSNTNYQTTLKLGSIHYDKKESILLDMEEGNYNSINLTLGKGEGKNIWSLIMPTKEDMENLSNLESIFPGISNIYGTGQNKEEKTYDFKILELIKNKS